MSASDFPVVGTSSDLQGHTILDQSHQTKEGKAKTKVNFHADLIIPLHEGTQHRACSRGTFCFSFYHQWISTGKSKSTRDSQGVRSRDKGKETRSAESFLFSSNDIHSRAAAHSRTLAPREAPSCD